MAAPEAKHEPLMRSLRRRLAPQVIKELVARYNDGATIRALSLEYDVSRSGLRQLLRGEGVEFRRQSTISENSDLAVKLYESGLTIQEVATKIGSSPETLRRELHRRGVPMRPSGRWNHLPPKLNAVEDQ